MLSSMDYKKAYKGNQGPNTGGMGAIAPNPYYTKEIAHWCMENIFMPTIKAMKSENSTFKGCLYFGLMLTAKGPKVIEYNCRFGDPETQCILPLLKSDLLEIMMAVAKEKLDETEVVFADEAHSCCVSLCSKGYPLKYETGKEITIKAPLPQGVKIFDCGSKKLESKTNITNSGRVLSLVAQGKTLEQARKAAYEGLQYVHFENLYYRDDIGKM